MKFLNKNFFKKLGLLLLIFIIGYVIYYMTVRPLTEGDWQTQLAIPSTAEFSEDGGSVTVKNVRNFRYVPTEKDMIPGYYDKTYDLNGVKKVWFISEPFNENDLAAHTFVSFEFENGDFLSISIEALKTKDQVYSIWEGMLRTYPLIYVAADERDTILLRANVRKDKVYVYPIKLEKPENGRLLLVDMLNKMNKLIVEPEWYNTFFSNCTSMIAKHVNNLSPNRISPFSWELWLTASADELALEKGLLDTDLSIEEARLKYYVNDISEEIGDVPNYSKEIRREFY